MNIRSCAIALLVAIAVTVPLAAEAAYTLSVSTSNTRSNAVSLGGAILGGSRYVFLTPATGVSRVRFWLNNATASGTPRHTENAAPWDFGGGTSTTAYPFDTRTLPDGSHSITAVATLSTGTTVAVTSYFTVANTTTSSSTPYTLAVSSSSTRTSPISLAGSTLSGSRYIFLTPPTGISRVRFWLDNAGATGTPRQTEHYAPWDFAGGTEMAANAFDTRMVANGSHTVTAAVTLANGSTVTMTSNFTVANTTTTSTTTPSTTTPSAGTPTSTTVDIGGSNFYLNGTITYPGKMAQGKLMNVRMVNSTFEDRSGLHPTFNPEANTDEFIAAMPSYVSAGVRAFTLNLQGGNPGYDGAINTGFNSDGSLRSTYMARIERVIRKADSLGSTVILGLFYFRQDQHLRDEAAVKAGVVNAMNWLQSRGLRNVLVEIANEHQNDMYNHGIIRSDWGMHSLIKLAKSTAPEYKVSASSWGILSLGQATIDASDFLLIHGNAHTLSQQVSEITSLRAYGKPIVMNEDHKSDAASATVKAGASWGFYYPSVNQYYPFRFYGTSDNSSVYSAIWQLTH